jgi:hypothetical protein
MGLPTPPQVKAMDYSSRGIPYLLVQAANYLANTFAANIDRFTANFGTWAIGSGVLQNTASNGGGGGWSDRVFTSTVDTFDDFDILVKVHKPSFNTQVIFRTGTTNGTGYGIQLRDTDVFRLESWGSSNLEQATPITWVTGDWYWVRIVCLGTNIKARVWADGGTEPGTWDIDYTGSEHTSGRIGFGGESAAGTAEYSDLLVTTITDPLLTQTMDFSSRGSPFVTNDDYEEVVVEVEAIRDVIMSGIIPFPRL